MTCLCASHAGELAAIRLANGEVVWRTQLPSRIEASCCVVGHASSADAVVLVGGHDGALHALRLMDGERLWSRICHGAVKAAATALPEHFGPSGVGEVALCADFGGVLTALIARSGRILWEDAVASDGPIFAAPTVHSESIYVAHMRGAVVCWRPPAEATSGDAGFSRTLAWRFVADADRDGRAAPVFSAHVIVDQAASGGGCPAMVVFGCTNGRLYALAASTGTRLWTFEMGGAVFATPCVVGAAIYATSDGGALCCVDASDGSLLWSQPGAFRGHASPCACAGLIVAADVAGKICWFAAIDGQPLGVHELPAPVFSSPTTHAGRCVVGCRDDALWCLEFEKV